MFEQKGRCEMAKYSENQMKLRKEATKRYDDKTDKIMCRFPIGTKDRILRLGTSCNAFIKECVLEKLNEIEKNN